MTKYYSWGVNGFPPYVFDTIWKRWKLNGRGAVIVCDIPDGMTVAGNPAKPLPRKNPETSTA